MEEQDALHLLQFWFAVESFKISATSPEHATGPKRWLNLSTLAQVDDKQRHVVGMETKVDRQSHCTAIHQCETAVIDSRIKKEEGLDCECEIDVALQCNNLVSASNLSAKGTVYCRSNVKGSIRESRGQFSAKSDTSENQNKQLSAVNDVVPRNGLHVHEQLLKQLSLSKEVISLIAN